ncbi:uncharacterized protein GIQ15_02846 [Arthroderma uncinatum]|uniref:uncharacterized protein n=1 Tax=Arthroderma uncinatum TaxID=74035 RepID=UPI00144ACFCE|nr:uncharacterized protein GIQ15_02846 [Arthroderma uncinatum]KAF3483522.1 hypothetical protein GIQ15_02846 [Arthroderma uncinatum]
MMASSPTLAALLRASPNPPPPHNPPPAVSSSSSSSSTAPRPLDNPIHQASHHQHQHQLQLQEQSQPEQPQQPESGPCSSPEIELLRTTFKRQTVDAGTQYSRPTTPSRAVSLPSSNAAAAAAASTSSSSINQHSQRTSPNSRMPGTTIGSKRNTPDATKVLAAPGPSSATSNPSHQQQHHQQQHQQRRQQVEEEDGRPEGSASKRLRPAKPPVKLLPRRYETADPRDLVVLISSMIMELIRFNDQIPLRDGRLTRFHSRSPPRISVQDYLQRLTTHATLSPPILLSMVYYIDRLCALYPAFTISSLTVHRFLISSATVASKGLSDSFWTNKTYARVGGISVEELALLELEFLWRVEWRIVPQPEVLVDYYLSLVERCEEYEMQPQAPAPAIPVEVEAEAAVGARPAQISTLASASTTAPSVPSAPVAPSGSATSAEPSSPIVPSAPPAPSDSSPKTKPDPESEAAEKTEPDVVQSEQSSST